MIKNLFLIFSIAVFPFLIHAQSVNEDQLKDFDYLVELIKSDYPGFNDKVKPDLAVLEIKLRNKIKEYPDSVLFYMEEYIAYFNDKHLRINSLKQNTSKNASESKVNDLPQHNFNRQQSEKKNKNRDNIEGLWVSWENEIAIVKSENGENFYYGFFENPKNGFIKFVPINDSLFNYYAIKTSSRFPKKGKAALNMKKNLLEIHHTNLVFVRKSDPVYEKAYISTYRPEYPNGSNNYSMDTALDDSTFYLRISSFHPANKDKIENIIRNNWSYIIKRPYLIIDIRNNRGGIDDSYKLLSTLIYTDPVRNYGIEWYASEGNITRMKETLKKGNIRNGEDGIKWMESLVDEMEKNIGGFVIHPFDQNKPGYTTYDTVYTNPRKIGIIIDKTNASSAEQFLLFAKSSSKTILFGNENTAGILDYSNTNLCEFPSGNFELRCPMSRSRRLPAYPIDGTGIAPDITIPFPPCDQLFDRMDDWVYFVKNYLQFADEQKN